MNTRYYPEKPTDISPLLLGEFIPKAILLNQNVEEVDLNVLISNKPTILVFYRGGWCPYCTKQLSGLQEISDELIDLGYQIIAISTDSPEKLNNTSGELSLPYILLSDLSLAKEMGIAFKGPSDYKDILVKSTAGKNMDFLLPVPSVFILDKKGEIKFEYINPNFKQRLKPELLKVVAENIIVDL